MFFFESPALQQPVRSRRTSLNSYKSYDYWYKEQLLQEKAALRYAREKMAVAAESKIELDRRRGLDQAYGKDNPLSELTEGVLKELEDRASGYYGEKLYGRELTALERHDVARAMVLRDLSPRLFDPISLHLTEEALRSFSMDERKGAPFLSVSTRGGAFNWQQLLRDPLHNHLQPGRELWTTTDFGPLARGAMKLELKVNGPAPVKLKLSVLPGGGGLRWSLWGGSRYRTEHRKLLGKLNGILDDYTLRLQWAEQYREGMAVPRLRADELQQLRQILSIFYDLKNDALDPLKQSMLLKGVPEEPIETRRPNSSSPVQIYAVRCSECGRMISFEIIERLYPEKAEPIYVPSVPVEETAKALQQIHRASPCLRKHSEAVSSRTGEAVAA